MTMYQSANKLLLYSAYYLSLDSEGSTYILKQ